ncbi:MAG: hypothetical protein PHX60_15945 [Giesbergeria sp.]|uniref:hypothetical protein n=1 Tax=Giesbergeria sp. TaxID=2818473 RepID=UPI00260EF72A|nr:hypothetical protein [Giesbergeria sp.]MDD2611143.1 hypothetical protein [Giesbergeria sp.]
MADVFDDCMVHLMPTNMPDNNKQLALRAVLHASGFASRNLLSMAKLSCGLFVGTCDASTSPIASQ